MKNQILENQILENQGVIRIWRLTIKLWLLRVQVWTLNGEQATIGLKKQSVVVWCLMRSNLCEILPLNLLFNNLFLSPSLLQRWDEMCWWQLAECVNFHQTWVGMKWEREKWSERGRNEVREEEMREEELQFFNLKKDCWVKRLNLWDSPTNSENVVTKRRKEVLSFLHSSHFSRFLYATHSLILSIHQNLSFILIFSLFSLLLNTLSQNTESKRDHSFLCSGKVPVICWQNEKLNDWWTNNTLFNILPFIITQLWITKM